MANTQEREKESERDEEATGEISDGDGLIMELCILLHCLHSSPLLAFKYASLHLNTRTSHADNTSL